MNPRIVSDLIDHADEQMAGIVKRALDLFDDEAEGTLFLIALMGRHLAHMSKLLHDEDGETDVEALLTTALILAKFMDRRRDTPDPDQLRCNRRAAALLKKLQAAAGVLTR